MKKIDYASVNRSNNDIWALLNEAVKTKNWAIIQQNLNRLYSLQKFYIQKVNLQEIEIRVLKQSLAEAEELINDYQKEWLEEVSKRKGIYENLKERIDKTFRP